MTCKKCNDTGVIDTGNNDLPCDCVAAGLGFAKELQALLNRHSCESTSNTPNCILARYLLGCLMAFDLAVQQRETWNGYDPRPSVTKLMPRGAPAKKLGTVREVAARYFSGPPEEPARDTFADAHSFMLTIKEALDA